MSKVVTTIGIIVGLIIAMSQPSIANSIFAFVFAGAIPFTHIVLPFWMMILIIGLIGMLAILWLINQPFFIGDSVHAEKVAKERARRHVIAATEKQVNPPKKRSIKHRLRKNYQTVTH